MKFRETPCMFYESHLACAKGRPAEYKGYCQHCDKYRPRAKVRHLNKKKLAKHSSRYNCAEWKGA